MTTGTLDHLAGGLETTRLGPTDAQRHADKVRAATAYLTRTGNADLISVLGLDKPPEMAKFPRCANPDCGNEFVPQREKQVVCCPECGRVVRRQRALAARQCSGDGARP